MEQSSTGLMEAAPASQTTLKKISVQVGQNQVTIEPDRLAILPGDLVLFQANAVVQLSFPGLSPSLLSGSGQSPFTLGSAGLTFEIKDAGTNYPYEVHSASGALAGHTSQGDLHPPN